MSKLADREQNLFNATETLAQFYDEIESFFSILYRHMQAYGFTAKAERLRSGTFTVKNLTRRLLATISVMYIKSADEPEETEEAEEPEEEEANDLEEKAGKDTDITITSATKVAMVTLHLFTPKTIPSAHTLSSPLLLTGVLSNFEFVDKKNGQPVRNSEQVIGLANLGQITLKTDNKVGASLGIRCWKPKSMRKNKLQGTLIGFDARPLLEIDSQSKIKDIADRLVSYCGR